jgi:hypothetical protein
MVDIARESWGDAPPDWVLRLAEACDATSQAKVGARIGRSGSVVSQVLRNRYPGNVRGVEEMVRGVLMQAVVECPALGRLPAHECQRWRVASDHFLGTNSLRVRMYRACNRCPVKRQAREAKP